MSTMSYYYNVVMIRIEFITASMYTPFSRKFITIKVEIN